MTESDAVGVVLLAALDRFMRGNKVINVCVL